MMNWVTDWGGKNAYPLSFRFHTAMMGAMGVGADLTRYTEEEIKEAKAFIGFYKDIREVIQNGELYRLRQPSEDRWTVNQYLDPSKKTIVVIALKNPNPLSMFEIPSVRLKGLMPNDKYRLNSTERVFSGSFLGNVGFPILFEKRFNVSLLEPTHFQSQVFVFNRV
jgi:alpha-galactosidase